MRWRFGVLFQKKGHISEHIRRVDGHTVQIAVLSHQDVHGHQGDDVGSFIFGRLFLVCLKKGCSR